MNEKESNIRRKIKVHAIQLRVNKGIHHEMKLRYQKKIKIDNSKSKIEEIFEN